MNDKYKCMYMYMHVYHTCACMSIISHAFLMCVMFVDLMSDRERERKEKSEGE